MVCVTRQRLDARHVRVGRDFAVMRDPLRAALDQSDDDADNALSPLCLAILAGSHRDVRPKRDDRADKLAEIKTRLSRLEAGSKRKATKAILKR